MDPSAEEAASFGLTVEEASGPPIEVFEENLSTVNTFIALGTQWRVGPNGPTGMDYSAVLAVLQMNGTPRKAWREIFDGIRVMEDAALETIRARIKNQT